MKIGGTNGINGIHSQQAGVKPGQKEDAYSKSLQNQIDNAKKRLQELSSNTQMPPEEKMKKRQEIMKEINDLQNQLRQHEIELRKQEQQQKEDVKNEDPADSRQTQRQKDGNTAGFSDSSMQALLSADSSMKQAQVHGSVKTEMKDRAGVLETEIALDSSRGQDTSRKEAELAEAEGKEAAAAHAQISTLADADKKLQEAAKEQPSEETADYKKGQEPGEEARAVQADEQDPAQEVSRTNEQDYSNENKEENAKKESAEEETEKITFMLHHTGLPDDYKPVNVLL